MASGVPEKGPVTVERSRVRIASHLQPVPTAFPTSPHPFLTPPLLWLNPASADSSRGVPFSKVTWREASDETGVPFEDIIYEKAVGEGIAKITINRPEKWNAFRPRTAEELIRALSNAIDDSSIGIIILAGKAFHSGGNQYLRTSDGHVDCGSLELLSILDLQTKIWQLQKPIIAMVAGLADGDLYDLQMGCHLKIAADNVIFHKTSPKVEPKRAHEMWLLSHCFDAHEAKKMGFVNVVVPLEKLEQETLKCCRQMLRKSSTAVRVLKCSLGAVDDGHDNVKVNKRKPGTVNWATATLVGIFAGLLYGGSKEAAASVSKDAEVMLKLGSTPDKREQYRLMRDAMEKRFIRVTRGSIVGGVRLGMFTATFFGLQNLLADARGVHDVYNIAGAGSATAALFGLILPGSLKWRGRNVLLGSTLGATLGFPLGWAHLKLVEKANEVNSASTSPQNVDGKETKSGVQAAIERLEGNLRK